MATNIQSYAKEACGGFQKNWGLKLISDSILESQSSPCTHFEKKYLDRNEACYNLVFKKID